MKDNVAVFTPYPFKIGQKIYIKGSKRNGDWEVIDVTENKMTIKCPISGTELKCDRFCCLVEENKE
ncbi:conserved hypothetical protein [Desulfamplus magnetovallimortis]|uniref:Uncharacterized protein n=1 Tax=Desulfamplus magnetovallimortis TaxID=1246637 RepID=A0A1W1H6M9_9BACT|nr:hypothetical protein [Desulfamplus magnetovallimortis]SLM28141.1 conserved hypothetical protein [Desulfamplus magnetovallimortis]